jgi:hypothetical protein
VVIAEAEANTVIDELAARSSLRERDQEPQKIELLERDKEPSPLKTVIPATSLRRSLDGEEDVQFDISLSSEIGKSGKKKAVSHQRCLKRALKQWGRTNSHLC